MVSFLTKFDSIWSNNIVIPDTCPLLTIYEPRKLWPIHRMMHCNFFSAREVRLKRNNDQINYDSEKRRLNVNYFHPPPLSLSETPETWNINHESLICRIRSHFSSTNSLKNFGKRPSIRNAAKAACWVEKFKIFLGIDPSLSVCRKGLISPS